MPRLILTLFKSIRAEISQKSHSNLPRRTPQRGQISVYGGLENAQKRNRRTKGGQKSKEKSRNS